MAWSSPSTETWTNTRRGCVRARPANRRARRRCPRPSSRHPNPRRRRRSIRTGWARRRRGWPSSSARSPTSKPSWPNRRSTPMAPGSSTSARSRPHCERSWTKPKANCWHCMAERARRLAGAARRGYGAAMNASNRPGGRRFQPLVVIALSAAVGVSACKVEVELPAPDPAAQADRATVTMENAPPDTGRQAPADAFLAALAMHCGQAFEGRIAANRPASSEPDAFAGKRMVMHVRGCEDPARELRVPFHVGDDHSRTWVLTRTADGLRLKHDHRHEDGSEDAVTMYGGETTAPGTAVR